MSGQIGLSKNIARAALLAGVSAAALLRLAAAASAQEPTPVPDVTVTAPAQSPVFLGAPAPLNPSPVAAAANAPVAAPTWPGASTATPTLFDGSAAAGYRVGASTGAGPIFGDLPLQDTPYSITVVPASLIENLQAYQPEDIVKVLPQVTNVLTQQNSSGNPFLYVRGFSITEFTNGAGVSYDGMIGGAGGMFANVLEDKERVELLSGADGFLYGTGSVGGELNYVLKRPTATTYTSITAGDNAGGNGFVHGDFGGPLKIPGLKDDLFGYRINMVYQGGDTEILDQSVKRSLISAAFDFRPLDNVLLQTNITHTDYHIYGETPQFGVVSNNLSPYPAPANPAQLPALPLGLDFADDIFGLKLTWKINDMFTFRSEWSYTNEQRDYLNGTGSVSSTLQNYLGAITQTVRGNNQVLNWYTSSGYAFLDAKISTFGIDHKITAGFTGFQQLANESPLQENSLTYPQKGDFYNLSPLPQLPTYWSIVNDAHDYAKSFAKNFIIGDEISVGDKLKIFAGANYTTLGSESYNGGLSGTYASGGYDAGAVTPSVAALYKIVPWLTAYASYQQSLQQGVDVLNSGTTIYTNNGTVLPPYLSFQYEAGVKATIGKNVLVTAALFDINKANQYVQNNYDGTYTYEQGGREDHKGLELTASGKATEDWTVVGGLTLLNPRIYDNPTSPWQNGQLASGVSPISGKVYLEYNVPYFESMPALSFLKGLTVIGGFQYYGQFSGDLPTSYQTIPSIYKFPGYSTGSFGLRYATKLYDKDVIFRFNVNNIANAAYWVNSGYEGAPRQFLASMQVKF